MYFLWASITTLVSRIFLNLRAATTSGSDWVMAGTQWAENTSPTDTRFILRNTIGGTPMRRAPAQDTVYTIGYGYGESSMILSGREDRVLGISDADPERKDTGQAYEEVSLSSDDGSLFENDQQSFGAACWGGSDGRHTACHCNLARV